MASKHINVEKLFKGRSYKKGEAASDPREPGFTKKAVFTIRDRRDRDARRVDEKSK